MGPKASASHQSGWAVSQREAKGQLMSVRPEPWHPPPTTEEWGAMFGLPFINRNVGNATWVKTENAGRSGHVF